MKEQIQKQESKKNNLGFWDRYRLKQIEKTKKKLLMMNESSGSSIFFHTIFLNVLDLVMWGIIAVFVYIWWITRGQGVDCNTCFEALKNGGGYIYP